jgi:hypothetical protein
LSDEFLAAFTDDDINDRLLEKAPFEASEIADSVPKHSMQSL